MTAPNQSYRTLNPFASMATNGLMQHPPRSYVDLPFNYVFTIALTANQVVNGAQQAIDTDADFMWRALCFSSTGIFRVRFSDSQAFFLSNALIDSLNLSNDGSSPYVIFPEMPFPKGSRIGIDITDTSGNPNTVQLDFIGAKRYSI